MMRLGRLLSGRGLTWAKGVEAEDAARIGRVFAEHDVLLTPQLSRPSLRVGEFEGRGALWTLNGSAAFTPFTPMWNHVGHPAAAVPAGMSSGGLPLSVQLVGRRNDEATLLSLAAQIESERPWADRRPPVS
jgi:amidase